MTRPLPPDPEPDAAATRRHDLRNALNAVAMSVHLARRKIARDEAEQADEVLARAQASCARAVALLEDAAPDSATGASTE